MSIQPIVDNVKFSTLTLWKGMEIVSFGSQTHDIRKKNCLSLKVETLLVKTKNNLCLQCEDCACEISSLTLRRLMSYIYGAPILDVSRSHTTTQHSR